MSFSTKIVNTTAHLISVRVLKVKEIINKKLKDDTSQYLPKSSPLFL